MKYLLAGIVLSGALAGCGGTSSSDSSHTVTYTPSISSAGSQWNYSRSIVDNENNTINLSFADTITKVNPDGSFVETVSDPTHTSITVNGSAYSIQTIVSNVNSSFLTTSQTIDATTNCSFSPNGPGIAIPWNVGEGWTMSYTETCAGLGAYSSMQYGTVVDLESLTVPAGSFTTLKFSTTILGPAQDLFTTYWSDVVTGRVVKSVQNIGYLTNVPTTGYAVSVTDVLQSTN